MCTVQYSTLCNVHCTTFSVILKILRNVKFTKIELFFIRLHISTLYTFLIITFHKCYPDPNLSFHSAMRIGIDFLSQCNPDPNHFLFQCNPDPNHFLFQCNPDTNHFLFSAIRIRIISLQPGSKSFLSTVQSGSKSIPFTVQSGSESR